jgi:hypothetical protein
MKIYHFRRELWRNGYTVDIRCAQVWTEEELKKEGYWGEHYKYKAWPKPMVDKFVQHHIDIQDLSEKNQNAACSHVLRNYRPDLAGKNFKEEQGTEF